jgi:hypothetical protein
MILKAKQRGDGRQLGQYLLTMGENEQFGDEYVCMRIASAVLGNRLLGFPP